jgi:molybdopterin-guanine dinucleotide biosynthesis protein A
LNKPKATIEAHITGLILAGGKSTRMGGGDKCLRKLGDKTILDWVVAAMNAQVNTLILNVNGEKERFNQPNLTIISDSDSQLNLEDTGPLAGIYNALNHLHICSPQNTSPPETGSQSTAPQDNGADKSTYKNTDSEWLLCTPADCPFIPLDLAQRLHSTAIKDNKAMVFAKVNEQNHYLSSLWHISTRATMGDYLKSGKRSVWGLLASLDTSQVDYDTQLIGAPDSLQTIDPFFNINTPEELLFAQKLLIGRRDN